MVRPNRSQGSKGVVTRVTRYNAADREADLQWDIVNGIHADRIEQRAYLADAAFHLDRLRHNILDCLTGSNDAWLRAHLLADVDRINIKLEKALT